MTGTNRFGLVLQRRDDRLLRQLATLLVDQDDGVAALVRIDPDDHHRSSLLPIGGGMLGIGRRAYPSWGDTTLLSSHAGRSHDRRAGRTTDTSHEGN